MTLSTHIRWALGAGAVILALFVAEHVRDADRDAELVKLHQAIAADSTVRVVAVAKTDTAGAKLDTTVRAAARADTVWRDAAAASGARIDTILVAAVDDTVKIRALVQLDSALIRAGNALADTTQQLRAAAVQFRVDVSLERAAWAKERGDLAHALTVSESRARHWGLGVTAGAAVVRAPDGTVHAGPGVTLGVTYRW